MTNSQISINQRNWRGIAHVPFWSIDNRQYQKSTQELHRLTSNLPSVMEEVNRTQSRGRGVGL